MIGLTWLLSNIKELALTATIIFGLGSSIGWWKQKQETDRVANNLYKKEIQWKDEKGRMVTETTELRFTVEELQNVAARDSATLSDTEKILWEVNKETEALRIKNKELVEYHKAEMEAVQDLQTVATIKDNKLLCIEPIDTKHWKIDFEVTDGGAILAEAKYNADITTVVDRQRDKFTKKGKKRFFMARWIAPRWQYSNYTVSDDPNATIKNSVKINFDNRK